jgi:hypothetical protein
MRRTLSLFVEGAIALAVAAYFVIEGLAGTRALNVALAIVGVTSLIFFVVTRLEGAGHGGHAQRLYPFEWALCGVWVLVWGSLAYIALSEKHITLGAGKYGLGGGTSDGAAAVAVGFAALAAAGAGVGWLLRTSRYRALLRSILVASWLGGVTLYAYLGH